MMTGYDTGTCPVLPFFGYPRRSPGVVGATLVSRQISLDRPAARLFPSLMH